MTTFKESILFLLFEFLGTLLLTSLFNSTYQAGGDTAALLAGFYILWIFSAEITGSHFNPAITLAFMFRRDNRYPVLHGLLIVAAQYAGGFCGAIISYNLFQAYNIQPLSVKANSEGTTLLVQAMFIEAIGAMLLTFLYLTQTYKGTKVSDNLAIIAMIITATYVAIVLYGEVTGVVSGTPYNPAASLGLSFAIIFQSDLAKTDHTWVFLMFAYVGSLAAVFLFEFVYKNAMSVIKEAEE